MTTITTLFLDIGGVLLTNGWDRRIRKPDADIFRMALDIAQVKPEQVVYIEDRPMFVKVAQALGIMELFMPDTMQRRRNWQRSD
jgi:FMN phosphatase YigB (HAD superfamily)